MFPTDVSRFLIETVYFLREKKTLLRLLKVIGIQKHIFHVVALVNYKQSYLIIFIHQNKKKILGFLKQIKKCYSAKYIKYSQRLKEYSLLRK